jgi:hypothetical protein
MGRAVTGKRRELFALIRKGGAQPLHIDHEVWQRMLKLEASRQTKEKSEQGRYANSRRKTLGRTGARGMNGVRERLREKFNRSPGPDEIDYEMNRDKGYGGQNKRRGIVKLEMSPYKCPLEKTRWGRLPVVLYHVTVWVMKAMTSHRNSILEAPTRYLFQKYT